MLLQPGRRGVQLAAGNDPVAVAVPVEHRRFPFGQSIVRRRGAGHAARRKETGQADRGAVAFRMHAQQVNRQQTALGEPDRHHIAVVGNVRRHPCVDRGRRRVRVVIEIVAGWHTVMEPRVRARAEPKLPRAEPGQPQRRPQRREVVVRGDMPHQVGQILLVGAPTVQAQEHRTAGRRVASAAGPHHVGHRQRLAEPARHYGGFTSDQRLLLMLAHTHTISRPRFNHPLRARLRAQLRMVGTRKNPGGVDHRGEKGERRRKGSIVGNCCGSWPAVVLTVIM